MKKRTKITLIILAVVLVAGAVAISIFYAGNGKDNTEDFTTKYYNKEVSHVNYKGFYSLSREEQFEKLRKASKNAVDMTDFQDEIAEAKQQVETYCKEVLNMDFDEEIENTSVKVMDLPSSMPALNQDGVVYFRNVDVDMSINTDSGEDIVMNAIHEITHSVEPDDDEVKAKFGLDKEDDNYWNFTEDCTQYLVKQAVKHAGHSFHNNMGYNPQYIEKMVSDYPDIVIHYLTESFTSDEVEAIKNYNQTYGEE